MDMMTQGKGHKSKSNVIDVEASASSKYFLSFFSHCNCAVRNKTKNNIHPLISVYFWILALAMGLFGRGV